MGFYKYQYVYGLKKKILPSIPCSPFKDSPFGPLDPGIPINYNR